jgi:hypothetical protein
MLLQFIYGMNPVMGIESQNLSARGTSKGFGSFLARAAGWWYSMGALEGDSTS